MESLKSEIGHGYQERIAQLEEQLRNTRTSSEQNIAIEQFTEQVQIPSRPLYISMCPNSYISWSISIYPAT